VRGEITPAAAGKKSAELDLAAGTACVAFSPVDARHAEERRVLLGMRRRRDGVSGWANPYCWGVVEQESRHRVQTRGVGFFCAPTDGVREGFVMGRPAAPAAVFKVFQGQRHRLLAAQDRFGTYIAPEQFPREDKRI